MHQVLCFPSEKNTLQLDGGDINKIIDNGIDGKTCRTLYLQFSGDIAAMSDHSIHGDSEVVGYLFVRHALYE